jgi:hypothetical protein
VSNLAASKLLPTACWKRAWFATNQVCKYSKEKRRRFQSKAMHLRQESLHHKLHSVEWRNVWRKDLILQIVVLLLCHLFTQINQTSYDWFSNYHPLWWNLCPHLFSSVANFLTIDPIPAIYWPGISQI